MDAMTIRRVTGVCLLVLVASCASTPRWEKYAGPPVGTTWTNQIRGSGSYSGAAEVSSRMGEIMWNGQPHIAFHNGPSTLVARPDGSWVTMLDSGGQQVTSWEPPMAWGFPMAVGNRWKSSFRLINHAKNTSQAVEADFVVEAYEEVSVAAGNFKAYRVRMTNNVGDDNVWWFVPANGLFVKQKLVRGNQSPAGPGIRESELKALAIAK